MVIQRIVAMQRRGFRVYVSEFILRMAMQRIVSLRRRPLALHMQQQHCQAGAVVICGGALEEAATTQR